MPKIRQAIAVLAVAAFCIGFNTYRYPVVGQMVAAISQPPQDPDAKPTALKLAEKAANPNPERARSDALTHDATNSRSKRPAGAVCKDGVCTMPLPEAPTASLSSTSSHDAAATTPNSTDDKSAAPADSPKSDEPAEDSSSESPATPKAADLEDESKISESSPSDPKNESAKLESKSPDTEKAPSDTMASDNIGKSQKGDSKESSDKTKTAAKLASNSRSVTASPSSTDQSSVVLVPIRRTRMESKDASAEIAKAGSDANPEVQQESAAQGFRRLPSFEPSADAVPVQITPELVQSYPVTAAK